MASRIKLVVDEGMIISAAFSSRIEARASVTRDRHKYRCTERTVERHPFLVAQGSLIGF